MNCAHCQKEIPENYGGVYCPFCGKDLALANSLRSPGDNSVEPVKLNAKLFLLMFLGPPLLTLLSALLFRAENGGIPVMIGLIGAILGGITCGVMLAHRLAKTIAGRIFLCFLLASIMVFVSVTLCCFGCNLGGYQMNFR